MEYCESCGSAIAAGASFCASCGAPVGPPGPGALGPYVLLEEVGRGAMARVWRAWDPRLEREVAVKEPLFDPALPPAALEEMGRRFVREGVAAARLSHPNIVAIYEADVFDGRPAIVMELVRGATLSEVLARGPLPAAAAVDALCQLLDAVGYAHGRGVVHRDIKPDNVFVGSDGRVRLADFGVARVEGGAATRATVAGAVLGTPGYMSPEQATGGAADERSDLFSVGALAYEMLSGRPPFGSGGVTEVLYRVVHEQPPELAAPAGSGLPAAARDAVMAALSKDPADRPQSAAEFRAMLAGAPAPRAAAPAPRRDGAPAWLPYAAVGALGAVALAAALAAAAAPGRAGAAPASPAQAAAAAGAPEAADEPESAEPESSESEAAKDAEPAEEPAEPAEEPEPATESEAAPVEAPATTPDPEPEPTPEPDPAPAGQYPPQFSSVDASSEQSAEGYASSSYSPWMARDNDRTTAWIEGVDGSGYGQWICLYASSPQLVSGVRVMGGFPKSTEVYYANYRPREVVIELSDGYTKSSTLNDVYGEWQNIVFDGQHATTYVRLTIHTVYDTNYWTDTCIAEFDAY